MATDYPALLDRLALASDDSDIARAARPWTRDKLALIGYYLTPFARLCSEKAGGWVYVDGFAGNGANSVDEFGRAKGSALLGATTTPPPNYLIAIESDPTNFRALESRLRKIDPRFVVRNGDANNLLPELLNQVDRSLPGFCVRDPEGLELSWTTVELCARNRVRSYPYELLIYFSTPGAARSAGVQDSRFLDMNEDRLNRFFGNEQWRAVADPIRRGELPPGAGGRRFLDLYEKQLRALGYRTILHRPANSMAGTLVYHLIFASANAAGENIMKDALRRAYASQRPLL
jgi:three-Cys-motif partner protein